MPAVIGGLVAVGTLSVLAFVDLRSSSPGFALFFAELAAAAFGSAAALASML